MRALGRNILDFLKADFHLTFQNSLLSGILYLFCIPLIRGVSNLDSIRSADVLRESVALVGAVLLIPITKQETEAGVKELIGTKSWPYRKTVIFRLLCGFLFITVLILAFAAVMQNNHCVFPFWSYTGAAIGYAVFLGLLGLAASQAGNNVAAGYLTVLGYWSFLQASIIEESSPFYFFPIINGETDGQKLLLLLGIVILLAGSFMLLLKRTEHSF